MDELAMMIDRQLTMHARIDADPDLAWGKDGLVRTVLDEADCLIEEAVELKRALPHKKWKRDYAHPPSYHNVLDAQEEAIDCLHFALNLCIRLGLDSAPKLYDAFLAKNDVNIKRQDEGY